MWNCRTSATTTTYRLIQKSKLRDDAKGWAKMSNAPESILIKKEYHIKYDCTIVDCVLI